MGSVIDFMDCPVCDYEQGCFVDFYYKSGEEYRFCNRCGYSLTHEITNRDERDNMSDTSNWVPKFETSELVNVFGVFRYHTETGGGSGRFDSETGYKDFEISIKEEPSNITEASYTFKKNGKWYVKELTNNTVKECSKTHCF